jgi:hypothetical protein
MADEESSRRELAVTAAAQAVEAATELLRYAREGAWDHFPFQVDVEPLEKLCDAAKLTAEILDDQPDEDGDRNQLAGALEKFLSGWA